MISAEPLKDIQTIAIVDDDRENSVLWQMQVKAAGLSPLILDEPFENLDVFVARVKNGAQGAICDHKLRHLGGNWPFDGAEAVARLYEIQIPAILVTKYRRHEAEFSIRLYRRRIPVLLSREDVDPGSIIDGLANCALEISGETLPGRKPRRALVLIDGTEGEHIVAFVPQWNPDMAVNFSRTLFPENLQADVAKGQTYSALVNIGAQDSDELFFEDFQLAPPPDPNNGLS